MSERVFIFFRGTNDEAKSRIEVLGFIFALIRNMWRIVNYYIKCSRGKWHFCVIGYDLWSMLFLNVDSNYWTIAICPESAAIDRRI